MRMGQQVLMDDLELLCGMLTTIGIRKDISSNRDPVEFPPTKKYSRMTILGLIDEGVLGVERSLYSSCDVIFVAKPEHFEYSVSF